jgi:hypothetical protein
MVMALAFLAATGLFEFQLGQSSTQTETGQSGESDSLLVDEIAVPGKSGSDTNYLNWPVGATIGGVLPGGLPTLVNHVH